MKTSCRPNIQKLFLTEKAKTVKAKTTKALKKRRKLHLKDGSAKHVKLLSPSLEENNAIVVVRVNTKRLSKKRYLKT